MTAIEQMALGFQQWVLNLVRTNESTGQQAKAITPSDDQGTSGMPDREKDNAGQAGVDETKHS